MTRADDLGSLDTLMAFRAADWRARVAARVGDEDERGPQTAPASVAAATATPTASASMSSPPSPSPPRSPRPIEDTAACGIWLRRALVAGTLSQEAQQALTHMSQLRKGLVSAPVPLSVRRAIVNARLNPGLKSVLISELLHPSSLPGLRQTCQPPASIGTDGGDAPPDHPLSQQSSLETARPTLQKVFRMRRSKPSEQPGRPSSTHGVSRGLGFTLGPPSDASDALAPDSSGPVGTPSINVPSSPRRAASTGVANGLGSPDERHVIFHKFRGAIGGMSQGDGDTKSPTRKRKRTSDAFLPYHVGQAVDYPATSAARSRQGNRTSSGTASSKHELFRSSTAMADDEDPPNGTGHQSKDDRASRPGHRRTEAGRHEAVEGSRPEPFQALSPTTKFTAENGRPYNEWWLADGTKLITYGALLPTNYQTQSDLERPWICPVRTCRVMFSSLQSLGGHFNSSHRGVKLNDNMDGTLSFRGYYHGIGKLPAKVVSKNELDPNEYPMLEPSLPMSAQLKSRAVLATVRPALSSSLASSKTTPTAVTRQRGSTTTEVHPHSNHTSAPSLPLMHKPQRLRSETAQKQLGSKVRNGAYGAVSKTGFDSGTSPAEDDTPEMVMEDWEIAPGRMRNSSSEVIENVAFSGPYLRRNDETSIDQDDGAHILVINQGATHNFKALANRKRKCWVASGKVRVKLLEQDFEAGPDTLVLISPGTACVVENCWYSDAKMFVNVSPGPF